ncbi:hypothetical protein HanRHA438_Chr14g0663691 [Helianthus annuus]|nr:hypothetical protein HanRHA438_Chr14g0663691 [Helianthus annuus]
MMRLSLETLTSADTEELPPMLFIVVVVNNSVTGSPIPSPMAPISPTAIRNMSALSTCMKSDRNDPLLVSFLCLFIFTQQI